MGLGAAFGAGIHAYNREKESQATAKHNETTNELNQMRLDGAKVDLAYKQSPAYAKDQQIGRDLKMSQLETARMNAGTSRINAGVAQSEAQMKQDVYNKYMNPSDKKNRANQYKAQTRQVGAQVGATVPNQQDEITKVANENIQLKQNQDDFQAKTTTSQVVGNMYRDLANGGSATDSYDAFNQVIGSDPVMSQLIKGPISSFNYNDEKQMNSLTSYAAKTLGEGYEEEELAMTVEGLKEMTKIGLIGWSQANGEVVDLTGAITAMGVTKGLPATDVKGVDAKATKAMEKGQKIYQDKMGLRETPVWHKEASLEKKLWNGDDPQEAMTMMEMAELNIPTELKDMVKANSEMVTDRGYYRGATPGEVVKSVENQTNQLMQPGLTPETAEMLEIRANEGISLMKDSEERKQARKSLKLSSDMATVNQAWESTEPIDASSKQGLVNMQLTNTEASTSLSKERDEINDKVEMVDGVNDILGRLEELQHDIVSGVFAPIVVEEASRNLGFIETVWNKGSSKKGKIDKDRLLASIEANTLIGKLVVDFVKQTSGASVTEDEYNRLRIIIAGVEGGDPRAMATAMQTFRDSNIKTIERDVSKPNIKYKLPATAYENRRLSKGQINYRERITSEGFTTGNAISGVTGTGTTSAPAREKPAYLKGE